MRRHPYWRWMAALMIIGRAAAELFAHGLLRPGAPARLSRSTGRVAPR